MAEETLRSSNLRTPTQTSPRSFLAQTVKMKLDGYNEILREAINVSESESETCAVITLYGNVRLAGFYPDKIKVTIIEHIIIKQYCMEILLNSFHLNGCTIGFYPQS